MSRIVEKDFVMRMVRQLAELLARALKLRVAGQPEQALEVLEQASVELLGMELAPLVLVDAEAAAHVLGHPVKVRLLARLAEEMSAIHAAKGDSIAAALRQRQALELYTEVLRGAEDEEARQGLERLLPKVEPSSLSERCRSWLGARRR